MKAKITKVEQGKEWKNDYGTFFPHRVTFDNKDKVVINKTKKDAYQVGQELEYEITGEDKVGNIKAKEVRENPQDKIQTYIIRQSSVRTAVEYHTSESIEDVLKTAEKIETWVCR